MDRGSARTLTNIYMGVSVINGYSEFLPSFGNSYVHHREFKCCVSETEKKTLAKKIH